MPSASYDTDIGTNGITCVWKSCCILFQLSWSMKCNGAIEDAAGLYDAGVSGINWPEKTCCTSFWLSLPKEHNGAFMLLLASCDTLLIPMALGDTNTNGMWCHCQWELCHMTKMPCYIMWCQHQCQWHHMTKKVMLHLISIILTWTYKRTIYNAVGIIWHWHWCQWPHVTSTPMHHMIQCQCNVMPVVSHDEKSCVAPHFDWLDLRSVIVPIIMLMALHDAKTGPSSMTLLRKITLYLIWIILI